MRGREDEHEQGRGRERERDRERETERERERILNRLHASMEFNSTFDPTILG